MRGSARIRTLLRPDGGGAEAAKAAAVGLQAGEERYGQDRTVKTKLLTLERAPDHRWRALGAGLHRPGHASRAQPETMFSASVCYKLVIVVRPDEQDFQGTAVVCEVAKRLDVPTVEMVTNKVIEGIDPDSLKERIMEAFGHPVVGVLHMETELGRLGSRDVFAGRFPDHASTARLSHGTPEPR